VFCKGAKKERGRRGREERMRAGFFGGYREGESFHSHVVEEVHHRF
jgi:hypothetical protein